MEVQLKTFLSSGGKGGLLSGWIIREFDTLVNTWEVDQRIEKSNPMKASFQYFILINILSEIVSFNSKFCWLNTFDSNSYVYDKSNKTQAKG